MLAEAAQIEEETFGRVMDAVRPQNWRKIPLLARGDNVLKKHMDFASQNKEEYMETLKGLRLLMLLMRRLLKR